MKSKCCNAEIVKTGFRRFGESQRYKCLKCHKEIMPKKFLGLFTFIVLSLSLLLLLPSVFALSTTGSVDWNSNVGQIRSDFYGVNAYGFTQYENMSNDGDCTRESYSNYTLVKNNLLDVNFGMIRVDSQLNSHLNSSLDWYAMGEFQDKIKWAYDNNIKINLLINQMPFWIRNTTDTNAPCTSNGVTCPPRNYTEWGDLIVEFINISTNNSQYLSTIGIVAIWNEPELNLLANLTNTVGNASVRSIYYNRIYNASYLAIKQAYPNLAVGGPTTITDSTGGPTILAGFLSNFSQQMDAVIFHKYYTDGQSFTGPQTAIETILTACSLYSANCSRIYYDEWNAESSSNNLLTIKHGAILGNAFSFGINNYPLNLSLQPFKFNTEYTNDSCSSNTNYSMMKVTTNTKTISYNITKLFANNHKANNYVVSSSVADSTVKIVASKDSNGQKYITLTNTNTSAFDVTLSGMTTDFVDVQTGERYNLNDGSNTITINGLASYEVLTLRSLETVGIGSTCDSTTITFYKIILDMAGLAVLAVVLYLIFKDGWEDITIQKMLIAGIAIIVGVILFQQSAGNLGIGNCP